MTIQKLITLLASYSHVGNAYFRAYYIRLTLYLKLKRLFLDGLDNAVTNLYSLSCNPSKNPLFIQICLLLDEGQGQEQGLDAILRNEIQKVGNFL